MVPVQPHPVTPGSGALDRKATVSGRKKMRGSALLFAGGRRDGIRPGRYLALLDTGPAGRKFRAEHEAAPSSAGIAGGVLPAPVTDPVFHGTDLGSICPAGKIEAVTVVKPQVVWPGVWAGRVVGIVGGTGAGVVFPPEVTVHPAMRRNAARRNPARGNTAEGLMVSLQPE